jgi:hypothetical protein
MPKSTRPCRHKDSGQNNRGHPWKTNSKYSTEKMKWSQASRAKLCKVQKHRVLPKLAGKGMTWVQPKEKKKGKRKKEKRERIDWGSWSILSDPPKVLMGD